jgi:hypothetical protein
MPAPRLAAAIVVCCAFGAAAEEPVRQQDLRELSVARARQLVDACGGKGYIYLNSLEELSAGAAAELARHGAWLACDRLQTISPETAAALEPFSGRLSLVGVKSLSDEAAIALARCRAQTLSLAALTTLSTRGQDGLAAFEGSLSLPALRALTSGALAERFVQQNDPIPANLVELSADAARALARLPGMLRLDGLKTLSAEAAGLLANRPKGGLSLRGLESLSPEVARALVPTAGPLILDGLESVTPEVAEILAAKAGGLSLNRLRNVPHPALLDRLVRTNGLGGMRSLPDDVLTAVAAMRGDRALDGLTELTAAQAEILGTHDGPLSLNGLASLSDEAARGLLCHREPLQLANLSDFSPATLALIMRHQHLGQRWLNGLRTLSATGARAIAGLDAGQMLSLPGLKTLSAETATALAGFRGTHLMLNGVNELTPATAAALADSRAKVVSVTGLKSLSPETAAALVKCRTWDGSLPNLRELPVEVARALAGHRGPQLKLLGLAAISPQSIDALAAYRGGSLLVGVRPLTPEVVEALAACDAWQPETSTLATLTPGAARVLVNHRQWNGNLPAITGFDSPAAVEIARILAGRVGPVMLPGLKRISPRTLLALIEKDDVFVPLVETLTLIPEPDGSPTDDIVLPQKFLDRQEQQRQPVIE